MEDICFEEVPTKWSLNLTTAPLTFYQIKTHLSAIKCMSMKGDGCVTGKSSSVVFCEVLPSHQCWRQHGFIVGVLFEWTSEPPKLNCQRTSAILPSFDMTLGAHTYVTNYGWEKRSDQISSCGTNYGLKHTTTNGGSALSFEHLKTSLFQELFSLIVIFTSLIIMATQLQQIHKETTSSLIKASVSHMNGEVPQWATVWLLWTY